MERTPLSRIHVQVAQPATKYSAYESESCDTQLTRTFPDEESFDIVRHAKLCLEMLRIDTTQIYFSSEID